MLLLFSSLSLCSIQFAADFNFRILDNAGWYGPKSRFDGYSGFAVVLDSSTNFTSFFADTRPRPEILVLPLSLVTKSNIDTIQSLYTPKSYLQGIIILVNDSAAFSYDVPFPNSQQSHYPTNNYQWNTVGDSLSISKTDIPIVYPPESVKNSIIEHISKYGSRSGFYLRIFMEARLNDKQCLEDATCMFIGGTSLFGSFADDYDGPAVWAISPMDSTGLFPYGATGADQSVSGFVAHILALEAFKDADWSTATRPLRFAFFDAEFHGYLGGHRFLNDVALFECKKWSDDKKACLKPYRLSLDFQRVSAQDLADSIIVEMSSIANTTKLYGHSKTTGLVKELQTITDLTVPIEEANSNLPGLPPSSSHSFLKKFPDIQHVVLTGFNEHYPNDNRYGSPSDVLYDVDSVANSAQTLADVLAHLCNVTLVHSINRTAVQQMMDGFLKVPRDSALLVSLFPNHELPSDHVSLYSGVYQGYVYEMKHLVVKAILTDVIADLVSEKTCKEDGDCTELGIDWICGKKEVCIHVMLHPHPAYSGAYEYDSEEETQSLVNEDPGLPRGVESNWLLPDLQIVTLPNLYTGRVACGIGIVLWSLSAIGFTVFWSANLKHLKSKD